MIPGAPDCSICVHIDDQLSLSSFDNPRIILSYINREDALPLFDQHEINNLWLPLQKLALRRLFSAPHDAAEYDKNQQDILFQGWSSRALPKHWHFASEDGDDMMRSVKILGEGSFGLVEEVVLDTQPEPIVCVRKRFVRPHRLNGQQKLFEAFRREINVMRQVSHRHCVEIVGSYTDYDSVAMLSSPVADMDLAAFLDRSELSPAQLSTLRQGIGCLCGALAYLHGKHIRHKDLKPQNVLIHGENILLTDFGCSLDFSDDCVSTTTGRPAGLTARYAAPEVIEFEPRSRATDIYSLGCIIYEMLSRLRGHRLSEMKSYWKQTGNGHLSFSINSEAKDAWIHKLFHEDYNHTKDQVLLLFNEKLLNQNRHLRPSAEQILHKLEELDRLLPSDSQLLRSCCKHADKDAENEEGASGVRLEQLQQRRQITARHALPSFSSDCTFILLDFDLRVIARKNHDFIPEGPESEIAFHVGKPARIERACANLHAAALEMNCTSELWHIHARDKQSINIRDHANGIQHALLAADVSTIRDSVSTDVFCTVRLPSGAWSSKERWVQVFLIPIRFRKIASFACFFYMATFWVGDDSEKQQQQSAMTHNNKYASRGYDGFDGETHGGFELPHWDTMTRVDYGQAQVQPAERSSHQPQRLQKSEYPKLETRPYDQGGV